MAFLDNKRTWKNKEADRKDSRSVGMAQAGAYAQCIVKQLKEKANEQEKAKIEAWEQGHLSLAQQKFAKQNFSYLFNNVFRIKLLLNPNVSFEEKFSGLPVEKQNELLSFYSDLNDAFYHGANTKKEKLDRAHAFTTVLKRKKVLDLASFFKDNARFKDFLENMSHQKLFKKAVSRISPLTFDDIRFRKEKIKFFLKYRNTILVMLETDWFREYLVTVLDNLEEQESVKQFIQEIKEALEAQDDSKQVLAQRTIKKFFSILQSAESERDKELEEFLNEHLEVLYFFAKDERFNKLRPLLKRIDKLGAKEKGFYGASLSIISAEIEKIENEFVTVSQEINSFAAESKYQHLNHLVNGHWGMEQPFRIGGFKRQKAHIESLLAKEGFVKRDDLLLHANAFHLLKLKKEGASAQTLKEQKAYRKELKDYCSRLDSVAAILIEKAGELNHPYAHLPQDKEIKQKKATKLKELAAQAKLPGTDIPGLMMQKRQIEQRLLQAKPIELTEIRDYINTFEGAVLYTHEHEDVRRGTSDVKNWLNQATEWVTEGLRKLFKPKPSRNNNPLNTQDKAEDREIPWHMQMFFTKTQKTVHELAKGTMDELKEFYRAEVRPRGM